MANDFFNKISEIQEQINKLYTEIYNLKNKPIQTIDEDVIIRKIIQKMPTSQSNGVSVNEEEIISKVLARVPKTVGSVTYEVAPLEKIKKDFLEEAKNKILTDIQTLKSDEKKALKYLESVNRGVKANELITKCFLQKDGGSSRVET